MKSIGVISPPDGRTIVAGEASGRMHFLGLEGLPVGENAACLH